jgi:ABC-type branched-subunit amino acid transport system ATPase component
VSAPSLSVRDLEVSYTGAAPAVRGYSVDLAPGTITVMLGRNGAGKTSTLRGITGFLDYERATAGGTVTVRGQLV